MTKASCWKSDGPQGPAVSILVDNEIFTCHTTQLHEWEAWAVANKMVDCWNKANNSSFDTPLNETQAIEAASMLCIPDDFVKMVFNQCEGRGWVDGAGIPIKSFRSHVNYRWHRERGSYQEKKEGKEGVWALKQRLEAIDKEITQMTDPDSLSYAKFRDRAGRLLEEERENLAKLKANKKALTQQLVGL